MLFCSTSFMFGFLPMVLLIYYIIPNSKIKIKNIILLIFSLIFYAWGEPKFVFIMLLSIIGNYFFGIIIHRNSLLRKNNLLLGIAFNLAIIFVFKYLNFTIDNINVLLEILSIDMVLNKTELVLPIGISFFTFQSISYLIDVYRNEVPVQKNIFNLGLYISFFPQLIAGPIVRYFDISKEIYERKVTITDFSEGVSRFIFGLSKKVLISNNVAIVADIAFADGLEGTLTFATSWLGVLAYTLQIYFDFSGYSDMAIGLGKMFGFNFNENFDYPYISKSISEFWRRWHISLGSWFRDYVYFPLGGSRVTCKLRLLINLFVVWFLTGIWHGANWTFIIWGLMYFILIAFEKLTGIPEKKSNVVKKGYSFFAMLMIILGWVVFRADSIYSAFDYIQTMFMVGDVVLVDNLSIELFFEHFVIFGIGILFSTPLIKNLLIRISKKRDGIVEMVTFIVGIVLFIFVISEIVLSVYNPFIYFNF